jgi:hypothetical protein
LKPVIKVVGKLNNLRMSYTFNAEPRVVKTKPKFRQGDPYLLKPSDLERQYVTEMEEKYKIESMER